MARHSQYCRRLAEFPRRRHCFRRAHRQSKDPSPSGLACDQRSLASRRSSTILHGRRTWARTRRPVPTRRTRTSAPTKRSRLARICSARSSPPASRSRPRPSPDSWPTNGPSSARAERSRRVWPSTTTRPKASRHTRCCSESPPHRRHGPWKPRRKSSRKTIALMKTRALVAQEHPVPGTLFPHANEVPFKAQGPAGHARIPTRPLRFMATGAVPRDALFIVQPGSTNVGVAGSGLSEISGFGKVND